MKTILLTAAWEIFDLSGAQGVDIGVARDMFCENLSTWAEGQPLHYEGAKADYAALAPVWQGMTGEEQAEAKTLYHQATQAQYKAITTAYREGDKAAFYLALLAFEAEEKEQPSYLLYSHAWDIWDKADAEGISLAEAKAAYIETLEGWADLTDGEKAAENAWFDAKVVTYDQGLKYARLTGNRALFEAVLAAR